MRPWGCLETCSRCLCLSLEGLLGHSRHNVCQFLPLLSLLEHLNPVLVDWLVDRLTCSEARSYLAMAGLELLVLLTHPYPPSSGITSTCHHAWLEGHVKIHLGAHKMTQRATETDNQ